MNMPTRLPESIDSFVYAELVNIPHKTIIKYINNYKEQLDSFGKLEVITTDTTLGTSDHYILTKGHILFLTQLLPNTKLVYQVKEIILDQFCEMKKVLETFKQGRSWDEAKKTGRIERGDVILLLVRLNEHISEEWQHAPVNIAKLLEESETPLRTLVLNFYKLQDWTTGKELQPVNSLLESVVGDSINDGIKEKLPTVDIYRKAKEKILQIAGVVGVTEVLPLGSGNQNALAA